MQGTILSAPIWFAIITNLIALFVTIFLLEETEKEEKKMEGILYFHSSMFSDHVVTSLFLESEPISFASIKNRFARVRSLNLPWILVVLVLIEKMISGLFNATITASDFKTYSSLLLQFTPI